MSIDFRGFLPEYILSRDRRGFVQAIVQAWQQNYESISDQIDGLLLITDVDECDEVYLDYIAAMIGLNLLGIDSAEEKRVQIKNTVAAYKVKGTFTSWHIIFKTLGFDVDIDELWWGPTGDLQNTNPRPDLITGPNDPDVELPARILTSVDLTSGVDLSQGTDNLITLTISGAGPTTSSNVIDLTGFAVDPSAVTRSEIIAALNAAIPMFAPLSYSVTAKDIDSKQFILISTVETGVDAAIDIVGDKAEDVFGIIEADGADAVFLGTASSVNIPDTQFVPVNTLTVSASTVGVWGDDISIGIEDGTSATTQYNLVIYYDSGTGPEEVARFDDLTKSNTTDDVVATISGRTFYITVESLSGSTVRPATGTYALSGGAPPQNTKSPYVDITLTTPVFDPNFLNKAVYFDGRVDEVKAAHIRIRSKRIGISLSDDATVRSEVLDPVTLQLVPGVIQDYEDDVSVEVDAQITEILQNFCTFPTGAVGVYFHNGFIRGRDGTFTRSYTDIFPDGPQDPPSLAPASGSGNLAAGVYLVSYTYVDNYGETLPSPIASVKLSSTADDNSILIGSLAPLDSDLIGINYYISQAPYDATQLLAVFDASGAAQIINDLPLGPPTPTSNTSTRVGIPNQPGASSDVPGYVYDYSGVSGLTYGDSYDSIGNDFVYAFTFDSTICDGEMVLAEITGSGPGGSLPLDETSFYGVTVDQTPYFNGVWLANGMITFNNELLGPDTVSAPATSANPESTVVVIMRNPTTDERVLALDWKYTD